MPANILAMTKSEEMMMDIFWSSEKPLTSVDIVNMSVTKISLAATMAMMSESNKF